MHDVVQVTFGERYEMQLVFDDGRSGLFDMAALIEKGGIFGPLKEQDVFRSGFVVPDVGTVCWPNGADVCPDVLYSTVTGAPLPGFSTDRAQK